MVAPYEPASTTDGADFGDAWSNPTNAQTRDGSVANKSGLGADPQVHVLKLVIEGSVESAAPDESLPVAFSTTHPQLTNQDFTFSSLSITGAQLKSATSGFDFRTGGNTAEANTLVCRDYSIISTDVPDGNTVTAVVCRLSISKTANNAIVDVVEISSVTHSEPAAAASSEGSFRFMRPM